MLKDKKEPQPLQRLVVCGMLLALDVVLTRFASVNLWDRRIGFAFVAVAVAAYLYGPIAGAVVHGLNDFIGAMLFPYGPYFPGYTLTAAVIGLLYGLCFNRSRRFWRMAAGVFSTQVVGSLLLNTAWISLTNHTPYWSVLPGRLVQAGIMTVVQLVVLPPLFALLDRAAVLKK